MKEIKFKPEKEWYGKLIEDHIKIEDVSASQYIDENSILYGVNRNIGRDLPSIIDGLTPVERRMIYTMFYHGIGPTAKRVKVATIVGQTIDLVYPHGDQPLDNTNARLGRNWNMMIPYIDGEGNFGDMLTKKQASMRYRQARLSEYAWDCFFSETTRGYYNFDVRDNYNYSNYEPIWLPTKYPNILAQWNIGIGVGVSTSIAAFNFGELCDVAIKLIDNPKAKVEIYPDTPMPIYITNRELLQDCFDMNSFTIATRAPYHIEHTKGKNGENKTFVVFTSIAITEDVGSIKKKIKDLKDLDRKEGTKKLKEIKDINVDVSDKNGAIEGKNMRCYIEIEKGYNPTEVANKILRMTPFMTSIYVGYNVVQDNRVIRQTPRGILLEWINQRKNQKFRVLQRALTSVQHDIVIFSGLIKVSKHKGGIEKLVDIIRHHKNKDGSKPTKDELIEKLVEVFSITPRQGQYILELPLTSISSLSMEVNEKKVKELEEKYRNLLDVCCEEKIVESIKQELKEGKKKYSTPRNATFLDIDEEATKDMYVLYNTQGYYCVESLQSYKTDADKTFSMIPINTGKEYSVFYNTGKVAMVRGDAFIDSSVPGSIKATFMNADNGLETTGIIKILPNDAKYDYLLVASQKGFIKALDEKDVAGKAVSSLLNLEADDRLVRVIPLKKPLEDYILFTWAGSNIYYTDGKRVSIQKRGAAGVRLFKSCKDKLEGSALLPKDSKFVMVYGENGYCKVVDYSFITYTKAENMITFNGKGVNGIVGLSDSTELLYVEGDMTTPFTCTIKGKDVYMVNKAGGSIQLKVSSSISSPYKVFKKTKNEFYEIQVIK